MGAGRALDARNAYRDAIWRSTLTAAQRLLALAYAEHASHGIASVFVAPELLRSMTGLSQRTIVTTRAALIETGWLTLATPGRQHYAARYTLTIPASGADIAPLADTSDVQPLPPDVQFPHPDVQILHPNPGTNPGTNPQRRERRPGGWPIHEYEASARARLARLVQENRLPLEADWLLEQAYRAGDGNPWNGARAIAWAVEQQPLTGARDLGAMARARIKGARWQETA